MLIPYQAIAPTTLQQAQTDALLALLNLGLPQDAAAPSATSTQPKSAPAVKAPTSTAPLVWKVLVLDQQTKDVLATVLRVQDLRDAGVTLHVYVVSFRLSSGSSRHYSQLHSLRPPLPDVPAVYFVSPTLENIRRISEDLDKCLYESFHLNFVEPLPRALLEELAASVASSGTGELVEQVGLLIVLCWGRFHTYRTPASGRRPVSIVYRTITIFILPAVATAISRVSSRSISTQTLLLVPTSELPVVD